MRILILIAIGLLLYVIISNFVRKQKRLNNENKSEQNAEKMVKCHHCGLHILEQEALQSNGKYYCSQDHLEADQQ